MEENFPGRVKKVAEEVGGGAELARVTGISRRTIGFYMTGESDPSREKLILMADAARVSVEWLATGKGPMRLGDAQTLTPPPAAPGSVPIPLHSLSPSAGAGAFCEGDFIEEWIQIPQAIIDWMAVPIKFLCLTRVAGSSMTPTLTDGELIFVDRRYDRVIGEGIYVLRFENALLVKRIQVQPGGVLQIISDNPAFPPFSVSPKAPPGDFSILARIVSHLRKL